MNKNPYESPEQPSKGDLGGPTSQSVWRMAFLGALCLFGVSLMLRNWLPFEKAFGFSSLEWDNVVIASMLLVLVSFAATLVTGAAWFVAWVRNA
ncbi:hypothetical protein ETAA8_33350 [Anatilimnocola aggregata]|uniref:Uncharacterized protein n=1 Tax=Anatilimnocola aggregata TaxID=2528021 RepID=A0A517YDB9_9BACT|nr:hypothetical protein [Anatilimnocola aggregata]QDU28235.1 hypothetical protein ETAA8_33350 [Anatilimnocola aggregata]